MKIFLICDICVYKNKNCPKMFEYIYKYIIELVRVDIHL